MRFCQRHSIHLISDEIYALSVYRADTLHPGFTSVLSIDSTNIIDSRLVHVLYGFSKARSPLTMLNCSWSDCSGLCRRRSQTRMRGLEKSRAVQSCEISCVSPQLSCVFKIFKRILRRFHCASPLTDAIATTILEDGEFHTQFLEESARTLGEHQAIAAKALDEAEIPYTRKA
jgi:xeroderma pigmentosum group C-complementing protein